MQLFIQIQYKFVKKNKKLSFDNYALNFDHVALFFTYMINPVMNLSLFRSVCLPDALSFYGSGRACGFYWRDFNNVFMGIYNAESFIRWNNTPGISHSNY